jgi:glutamine amidotransferase
MAVTVGLVDYQAGNLQSIGNAFELLGARVLLVSDAAAFAACSHLVLPGVGAFGFCAERLRDSGMVGSLHDWAFVHGRPLLGICVGMQLLADESEESPGISGLGWLGGRVKRLEPAAGSVRVPHVGWNSVEFGADVGEFKAGNSADFYFDHSFACGAPAHGDLIGLCRHGRIFGAVWRLRNTLACQFHPEKSQSAGLRFLRGFLRL